MNTNTKLLETLEAGNIEKTIELLRQNIREETATKSGAKKPYKIIEKMLKDIGKNNPNRLFQVAHAYNGKYGFLDGYRLFLSEDTFGYDIAGVNSDIQPFKIDPLYKVNDYDLTTIEIDTAELRYFSKVAKKGRYEKQTPYIIRTPDGFAGYNPFYLLDLIEYTGSNKIRYQRRNAPIYSEDMQALLLPVNCRDMQTEADYNEYRAKWFNENNEEEAAA